MEKSTSEYCISPVGLIKNTVVSNRFAFQLTCTLRVCARSCATTRQRRA